jgi:Uma2 family endonuclease
MSALPQRRKISVGDYLVMERVSPVKHEYFNGEISQMAGASEEHAVISANITISIGSQLKDRPCKTYTSDMRVHIPATGLFTYPDVTVTCEKSAMLDDSYLDTLLNPTLIVEVLSPSTEAFDKGDKFDHYRSIESFREYLLVWQDKRRVARYTKSDNNSWVLTDFIGDEALIELSSIGCVLSMSDIYSKVDM